MKFLSLKIAVYLCLINASCKGQSNSDKTAVAAGAKELNNIAMITFSKNADNKDSILKAIFLLDQAIVKDSLFSAAYGNKATLLCSMGNYQEAISSLNKILSINSSLTELKSHKGFILEKTGDSLNAEETYREALKDYDNRLKTESNDVGLLLNRAFLFFFTENYDRGIKEFQIISDQYPNNNEVKGMSDIFKSFDRKNFIDSICSN